MYSEHKEDDEYKEDSNLKELELYLNKLKKISNITVNVRYFMIIIVSILIIFTVIITTIEFLYDYHEIYVIIAYFIGLFIGLSNLTATMICKYDDIQCWKKEIYLSKQNYKSNKHIIPIQRYQNYRYQTSFAYNYDNFIIIGSYKICLNQNRDLNEQNANIILSNINEYLNGSITILPNDLIPLDGYIKKKEIIINNISIIEFIKILFLHDYFNSYSLINLTEVNCWCCFNIFVPKKY